MSGERIQEAWENLGLQINSEYLSHLRFADDIVLLSESAEELQKLLRNYNWRASLWG